MIDDPHVFYFSLSPCQHFQGVCIRVYTPSYLFYPITRRLIAATTSRQWMSNLERDDFVFPFVFFADEHFPFSIQFGRFVSFSGVLLFFF